MRASIIFRNKLLQDKRKNIQQHKVPLWTIILWVAIWQVASMKLGFEILLASPVSVMTTLFGLIWKAEFWQAIIFSLGRITLGFIGAILLGIILSYLAFSCRFVQDILSLPIAVMKATPVASFIILVLIWLPSRELSILISFIMAFPIIYSNMMTGLQNMDSQLIDMAKVFQVPYWKRLRYMYLHQTFPYFRGACNLAIGMCWKAGIAAEVIGIPKGSIGERLYNAKIYLQTPELFAWTIVIIVVSILFEKIFVKILDCMIK